MKKKNKARAKKSITAVGAVVAAGLTPGIVTGTPAPESPSTDIELTAADVVSINGDVIDFDDLFAMHQVNRGQDRPKLVYGPPQPKVYGPPPAQIEKDKKKKKDKDQQRREQEIADSLMFEQMKHDEEMKALEEAREKARLDSIQRAMAESHKVVYGPPPPSMDFSLEPEKTRLLIIDCTKDEAINFVEHKIVEYLSSITDGNPYNVDFTNDNGSNREILTKLIEKVQQTYGVQVTDEMLKQLNNPNRLARFIVEIIKPIKE